MASIRKQLNSLNKTSKKSVALYHRVALSTGISDSALGVLYSLTEADSPCSQYELCNEWHIPKQTINSTVSVLQSKGLVELTPVPNTRNKKNISLTDTGKKFAEKTVCILRNAELGALATLSAEERELYICLNEKYNNALTEKIDSLLENFSNESA